MNIWEYIKGIELLQYLEYVKYPFFTFIGAFTLYVLNRLQNRQPFSIFAAINIDVGTTAQPRTILGDMIASSLLGVAVVIPLTAPSTVAQAIIAGLGMTGVLSTYSKAIKEG